MCIRDRLHNAPNYGANAEYRHISLCNGGVEYTMNYMDATDDNNMYSMTLGQMMRIIAILSEGGPRGSLKDAESLCSEQSLVAAERASNKMKLLLLFPVQVSPMPSGN